MPEENNQNMAKARSFFEKAQAVAKANNIDYAIDIYIQGLRHSPDALEEGHLPLCELALQRQKKGGKKPSMVDRMKGLRGRTPLEQMLNAEALFAKDPDHLPYAEAMLKAAVAGGYKKTAGWIANLVFQTNNASKRPSFQTYILLKDSYAALGQFDKAVVACQKASKMRPEDGKLTDEYKNLSAELTMSRGKYDQEGDFRKAIKNREQQEKLHAQSGVIKTQDYKVTTLEDARKKMAQNPNIPANIFAVADALAGMDTEKAENDAIALLENTYKAKQDYSYQKKADEIRMKQLRRKIKQAKDCLEKKPDDETIKNALEQLKKKLNDIELEHYRLVVLNYPTNLAPKYEYAIRLLKNGQYNEAIPLFQEAQNNPRRKIACMSKIGYCFFMKGWLADAIDVYNNAIETYEIKDDATGKDLRYNLARAYEENGNADKALEVFRKIAQVDFGYKDVSQRVDKLRNNKNEPTSQ
jgi:tetratricopeptide (TPR) repeat protein